MRRLGYILPLGALLILVLMQMKERIRVEPVAEANTTANLAPAEASATNPPFLNRFSVYPPVNEVAPDSAATNPATYLRADQPPEANPQVLLPKKPSLYDQIAGTIDPEELKQYEGSYSLDELHGDGSMQFKLNSAWVVGDLNTPQAGLTIRKNSKSGEYEISGGEVFLPSRGVGMSYEQDEEAGESRTFFNMKKEF
ncbi:hypothetical protein [Pontiella sulfatireligans]|uniref:Uncharacterized protein n=1 Tax=Pontiella sulfatireligans TaxID=2750658 RepID=A0A6C2UNE1_9BACT|nr:hypothetical protein [Pontiella sulfatireligans]VGO21698.1 hypothetical protein SCARR_03772 [Pontiella sulfatireligans]